MRELIYLSDAKVQQFLDTDHGRRRRRRINQVGATAPMGLGGLQVSLAEGATEQHPGLADVIRYLEHAKPPLNSFEDTGLRPGQWIRFVAAMSYQVFSFTPDFSDRRPQAAVPMPPTLLFWNPQPVVTRMPTRQWPTRLLLHGSPQHLTGGRPSAAEPDDASVIKSGTDPMTVVAFLRALAHEEVSFSFAERLGRLLSRLDDRYPAEIAAPVAGYARVTAVVRTFPEGEGSDNAEQATVVVATPLLVEFAR
ncbi:SAVMC3_10250 family protein [Catenulispora rubra]|uniref:SAVMC3_10250 family protein n=1 Tax=Catenulispora rubra TaxID=280293 RepID=UPI00189210E7|nr:SAVMC3_10250 family protein [Catenulispora rubra]